MTISIPKLPRVNGVTFRHVGGFPGYAVGDDGSVWSCRRRACGLAETWHRLQSYLMNGYPKVNLYLDKKIRPAFVHQLVLKAFRGPRSPGKQARHLDGDKLNNHISNLRWGTCSQNAQDRVRHGTCPLLARGEKAPACKFSDEMIAEARRLMKSGVTQVEVARRLGMSTAYVSLLHRNKYRFV